MKASQEVAAALILLDPVVFLIFVWASVILFLLVFSWAAFAITAPRKHRRLLNAGQARSEKCE